MLFKYFKDDKGKLVAYIIMTVITYFEPLVNAFIWSNAFQALSDGKQTLFNKYLLLYTLVLLVCWVFIQLPRDLLYNYLEKKFMNNVIKDMYAKVIELPAIAFEDKAAGEYISRITSDPDRVLELLRDMIGLTCRVITSIIIVFISFNTSLLVGFELLVLAFIMYLLSNVYFPKIKKTQEEIKTENDKYMKEATQNIIGIREIKALGIKDNINKRISKIADVVFKKRKEISKDEAIYYAINNLCFFFIQFVVLFTLGFQYFHNMITLASFVLIESYIWRIDMTIESLSKFGVNANKISVSLTRIDEIMSNRLYDDEKFGNKTIKEDLCTIEFKNVSFRYRDDEALTLNNLSMKIEPQKKIAIVGKSGQGKSTVFNLLSRFFDVTDGEILIDGINIQDLSEKSLRNSISVIRQAPYLFNTTIFENFKIVKKDVTLKEIKEVCKKAYIDEYIESLPNKYETIIGEGGVNLSGGQQQRLAIARILLKDTKIILFDEATSALDNESQDYIKKTIDNLVKNHTIIIVAHRLSTIKDADLIYVVDKGKVIDVGTHKELMKLSKTYKKLYSGEVLD